MKIFNLTILKTKDYEEEIAQLEANYQSLHHEYEKDVRQRMTTLQYEEKAKLSKLRKLVKNNNEILKELEKWLKNPCMFATGEDYKNYAEAYLKLKKETFDYINY